MTWHTVTRWRRNEGVAGEWSGYPACPVWPRSIASPSRYKCFHPPRTPRLPVAYWTVAPAESHGLVLFAERRNLVSARVQLPAEARIYLVATSFWPAHQTSYVSVCSSVQSDRRLKLMSHLPLAPRLRMSVTSRHLSALLHGVLLLTGTNSSS
jgi:hypothetical protein